MIYLVQSYYNDKQGFPRKCLKIGYAKNIEERMKAYKTYNPSIQLLKTREGEYDLESFLHRYFDKYKLPDFNEWFIYKREIIDKFDILEIQEDTITREEYLEYIRKEIVANIIPEIYKYLRSQIPDLLDELKQEFDNDYNLYSSLYTEFPERECENIIIKTLKFLRETENNYFTDCDFSTDILDKFSKEIPRQRLKENVFRDECIFIYKLSDKDITMEEFNKISSDKLKKSSADIETFNISKTFQSGNIESDNLRISNLLEDIRLRIKVQKYYKDYTGINERTGEVVINKLVYLSEKRAFELRSNVYKSDVQVYNEFEELISNEVSDELFIQLNLELSKLSSILNSSGRFSYKMEAVCKLLLDDRFIGRIDLSDIRGLSRIYKNYLNYLSPERIRALGYKEANIIREINSIQSGDVIKEKVLQTFLLGSKYTLKEIKLELSKIYSDLGITKTSKASDLLEYFNIKEVFIYDSITKKQSKGYLILSLK